MNSNHLWVITDTWKYSYHTTIAMAAEFVEFVKDYGSAGHHHWLLKVLFVSHILQLLKHSKFASQKLVSLCKGNINVPICIYAYALICPCPYMVRLCVFCNIWLGIFSRHLLLWCWQTCRKSNSAVALLRAEQGPSEPSNDFVSKFGEPERAGEGARD